MVSHPAWRNPPLQEAVFEVRFPPVADYSIFVGAMAVLKRDKFPTVSKLPSDELPTTVNISGVIRHRFITQDETLIFQTGVDVISVNIISYAGFESFINNIEDILETASNYAAVGQVARLGLRYINRFEKVYDPFQVLNINPPFPAFDLATTARVQANHIKRQSDLKFLSINVDFPVAGSNLIFDLDVFQENFEPNSSSWQIKDLIKWADTAHDLVWENFEIFVSDLEKGKRE